jgi:methionine-rich copper-binding protein CopC
VKTLVAAVLGGVVACLTVAAAFAHAEPATISPGDGAVVNAVPATIVYEMSQDMARQDGAGGQPANNLEVFDASGKKVSTENAVVDDTDRSKLTLKMPATLAVGTYTVKWTTLSADDGDAANGQFTFIYDPSKPPATGTTVPRDTGIGQPAGSPTAAPAAAALNGGGGDSGTSWVLVMAVAVGMLAVGSGGTFLLIQKRP